MENGKKIALWVTVLFLILVGVRVGLIYRANHEEGPAKKEMADGPNLTDDDVVFYSLHKEHPDSIADERKLIGKTLWVSAGGQLDYYHYANHHVDYAHPVGTLRSPEPLIIKDVFEQVPPKSGRAVFRIPAGQRHMLLAFTMPNSADPNAVYGTPIGHFESGVYILLTDQIFFYDDPHKLFKYWGPETLAHIDKHEVVLGMTENQATMAFGEVLNPSSNSTGNRTLDFDNDGHPVSVVFENGKAVKITPDK
jgi:hypothetical protein